MITFYYAPWSRASTILWLLEELGVDYRIEQVDIRARGGTDEAYRRIQPNKKVPAIDDDGTIVTERAAITLHLCERFPEAGLAPRMGEPGRAAFLTWVVYSDSVFDPAVAARAHGLDYTSNDYSFGLFDDLVANLDRRLRANPFIAGERFTAADVQIGSGIGFTRDVLKVLPDLPSFRAYTDRLEARPAFQRAQAKDFEMAKAAGLPGAG